MNVLFYISEQLATKQNKKKKKKKKKGKKKLSGYREINCKLLCR